MNQFARSLTILIAILVMLSALTAGCSTQPQLTKEEMLKRRVQIMNDKGLTTDQKYALVQKLDTPPPSPFILPAILLIAISPLFVVMHLRAKAKQEEKRAAAERLRRLIEKRSRAAAEPAPPPVVYVDPTVVAQQEVEAIPSSQRAASFFTSRPYPADELVEITVLVGYQVRTVWATPIEAECVRAGTTPLVRALTYGDNRLPWYEWGGYDPYTHYWQAAGREWFWVESLLRASWLELDTINPDLPGYFDDSKTAELDWEKATARQTGVLYRWKMNRAPMVKLKRVIQMASSRRPRQVSRPKPKIDEVALAIEAAIEAKKRRPRKSSLKVDAPQPVAPVASKPTVPAKPLTPLEAVTQPRNFSKRTKPRIADPLPVTPESIRPALASNGNSSSSGKFSARPVSANGATKNGKSKLKTNGAQPIVAALPNVVAIPEPVPVAEAPSKPRKPRNGKSLQAPGGAKRTASDELAAAQAITELITVEPFVESNVTASQPDLLPHPVEIELAGEVMATASSITEIDEEAPAAATEPAPNTAAPRPAMKKKVRIYAYMKNAKAAAADSGRKDTEPSSPHSRKPRQTRPRRTVGTSKHAPKMRQVDVYPG